MRNNNVMALIFSNMHDESVRDLTAVRSMGSIPIGGRYRLIDFTLSSLVNAGVIKVGVVTKSHYQSLMDHIGSGKAWDLSRKHEGLCFLPPFNAQDDLYSGRVAALAGIGAFLERAREEYVILADSHLVGNIDYDRLIDAHLDSGADITIGYKRGPLPAQRNNLILTMDVDGRVADIQIGDANGEQNSYYGLGIYILRRDLLHRLVADAVSHNQMNFERDILQKYREDMRIQGAEVTEYVQTIHSLSSYFAANMAFLDSDVRAALFPKGRPVYTKVRDCAPATYGLHSQVSNSLVADGAHIDGTVRNSIIFRDVHIERDAVVENSIVMQDAVIHRGAHLDAVILDKNVTIHDGRCLRGADSYPVFITKGAVV